MAHLESQYHRYSRGGGHYGHTAAAGGAYGGGYGGGFERRGSAGNGNFCGWSGGSGRFGELTRPEGPLSQGVQFDDSKIISEQHYHHGDHHHHHHQRHMHHFHDLHLIQSATETMDLRNTPSVDTRVIPSDNGPIDMKLRPDCIGKMVFENGADQYGFGVHYRMDEGLGGSGGSGGAAGYGGAIGYSAAAGGYAPAYGAGRGRGGMMEEEVYHHRRTSQ